MTFGVCRRPRVGQVCVPLSILRLWAKSPVAVTKVRLRNGPESQYACDERHSLIFPNSHGHPLLAPSAFYSRSLDRPAPFSYMCIIYTYTYTHTHIGQQVEEKGSRCSTPGLYYCKRSSCTTARSEEARGLSPRAHT